MIIERHQFLFEIKTQKRITNITPKIRGILGYGLKKIYCSNYYIDCENCERIKECKYISLFKPSFIDKSAPTMFCIYIKKIKNPNLYKCLINSINSHFLATQILDSFYLMQKNGFGDEKIPYDVKYIKTGRIEINESWLEYMKTFYDSSIWKISLLTPYSPGYKSVEETLLNSAISRINSLSPEIKKYITANNKAEIKIIESKLKDKKVMKQSKDKNLYLHGFVGNILAELNMESYLLFKVCELVHLGRNISFGFGKIKVDKVL